MRKNPIFVVTILCLGLLFAQAGFAHPHNWEDSLKEYMEEHHQRAAFTVVTVEHGSGRWDVHEWDGNTLHSPPSTSPPSLETTPAGGAEITLPNPTGKAGGKKTKQFLLFLVDTNPLLYTTVQTEAKDVDTEDREQLSQFISLLSNVLVAGTAAIWQADPVPKPAVRHVSVEMNLQTMRKQILKWCPDCTLDGLEDRKSDLDKLRELLGEIQTWLADYHDPYGKSIAATQQGLTTALQGVKGLAEDIQRNSQERVAILQSVELASVSTPVCPSASFVTLATIRSNYQMLETEMKALTSVKAPCASTILELKEFLELALYSSAGDEKEVGDRFKKLLAKLKGASCPQLPDLERAIRTTADWFQSTDTGPLPQGRWNTLEGDAISGFLKNVSPLTSLLEHSNDLLDASREAQKKHDALVASAAANHLFFERCKEIFKHATIADHFNHGVIRVPRAELGYVALKPGKKRIEKFKVGVDPELKKGVVLDAQRHPVGIEKTYEIQCKGGYYQTRFDFGLIAYTDVESPELVEIDSPDDDDVKLISQKDLDNRSGEVALFLSWLPRKKEDAFFKLGPQVGVGLDTDEPSVFAGVSFALGRYVRLSGGWSVQQVNELRDGFELGDPVPPEGNFQDDGYDDGPYVALAINLNDLPFFKPDD